MSSIIATIRTNNKNGKDVKQIVFFLKQPPGPDKGFFLEKVGKNYIPTIWRLRHLSLS